MSVSSTQPGSDPEARDRTRAYYRTVGRFIEMELAQRRDADFWRAQARELGQPSVLELGAGTGRITRILAPHCRCVVAIDISLEMLRRAHRTLPSTLPVHLVAADMASFRLARTFDLALAANDPFAHLPSEEDRDRALRMAAEHLRPGGLFVLDALWLSEKTRRLALRPGGWERERSLDAPEEDASYTVRERWKLWNGGTRGRLRYEYRKNGQVVGRAEFQPRFWSPEEVRERFRAAGLRVRRMHGGYHGEPWDPETATALVVEATKTPLTKERE